MRVKTPQISWHNRDPLYSIDYHPSGRIATSGADNNIRIWKIDKNEEQGFSFSFLATLNRHTQATNVVRFSPNGEYLATGSDDRFIFIWQLNENATPSSSFGDEEQEENKEVWTVVHCLRGHVADVYDLAWSPDSKYILSASTDNTAIVWDALKGKSISFFRDHSHYVQGCAWDPLSQYLVTQSSDRSCRIYSINQSKSSKDKEFATNKYVLKRREYEIAVDNNNNNVDSSAVTDHPSVKTTSHLMFGDENLPTFFRRPTWSPDGSLLFVPTGIDRSSGQSDSHTVYVFARNNLNKPALHLPGHTKCTVAIRANPVLFQKRHTENRAADPTQDSMEVDNPSGGRKELFSLPHRIVFAVLTLDSVVIYDTENWHPITFVEGIHYAELTDATWTSDGLALLVSSKDGYVTTISFNQGELGEPLVVRPTTMTTTTTSTATTTTITTVQEQEVIVIS